MQSIINNKTKLKLLLGFGFAFLLVLLVQFLSSKSINGIIRNQKDLAEAQLTIEQVHTLEADISSFESKMRGFVLTGNEQFLEGNEAAKLRCLDKIDKLLTDSGSEKDKKLRNQLDGLINRKIEFNLEVLIVYDRQNNAPAISLINTGRGKVLMDSIIAVCDSIVAGEKERIDRHKEESAFNSTFALNADLISGFIILLAILASLIILFKDINDRIKLEKVLREEQKKVEKSMVIKEQFMANMSHEIRTPLNAMLGFSSLMENTQLSAQQKEYLQAIDSAGKSLMTIINDILDFSKIEAGLLGIENVPFSMQQLLQSVHTLFFPKAHCKNIKLFLSVDPKLPKLLSGDPTRLNQVMMNLIGNAVKFTSKGTVHISCEQISSTDGKITVRIAVTDTGIGIEAEKLETIFDRFTQADNATTRNYGGTGLGLSIAKKLIELQGGKIDVRSKPGEGSEFSFTLTYCIADDREYSIRERKTEVLNKAKGKKVLVVEDNPLNQKLARMLLGDKGIETIMAVNGQNALDELQKRQVDVILMDLQMPVMDGYEATKKIRNELKLDTPIIAMTANAMAGEYEKCISSGMSDYITKPFKAETLYTIIAKFLDGTAPFEKNSV
jgi:signal transduction histidine kinase/ActR/RegA family two-component response regulator